MFQIWTLVRPVFGRPDFGQTALDNDFHIFPPFRTGMTMQNWLRLNFHPTAAATAWRRNWATSSRQVPGQLPLSISWSPDSTSFWSQSVISRPSSFWAPWHSWLTWTLGWPNTPGWGSSLRYLKLTSTGSIWNPDVWNPNFCCSVFKTPRCPKNVRISDITLSVWNPY